MRLAADHLEVQLDVGTFAAAVTGSGTYGLGPLEVTLTEERWPTEPWSSMVDLPRGSWPAEGHLVPDERLQPNGTLLS